MSCAGTMLWYGTFVTPYVRIGLSWCNARTEKRTHTQTGYLILHFRLLYASVSLILVRWDLHFSLFDDTVEATVPRFCRV